MTADTPTARHYHRDHIADVLESINDDIARHPKRHPHLTAEERAMWASFPAQARSHRHDYVVLNPDRPILKYMLESRVGDYHPSTQP